MFFPCYIRIFLVLLTFTLPASLLFLWLRQPMYFPKEPGITSWGAPIVWEGTFDRILDDQKHHAQKTVIGLSVFAIGRYIQMYLRNFLETAELHFMPGHHVVFYVMVDDLSLVPKISLAPNRTMVITKVQKHSRWQDISMMRMRDIAELVVPRAIKEVDYLFCMDVDQEFTSHYSVETLGNLVAQLHSGFYILSRWFYTYETNPASAAYIAPTEGDYYYHAATFGGTVSAVLNLTLACLKGIQADKEKGIEAIWHDESHLNHYLLKTKPTKLLSPEYCWNRWLNVQHSRLRWMPKEYNTVRENPERH